MDPQGGGGKLFMAEGARFQHWRTSPFSADHPLVGGLNPALGYGMVAMRTALGEGWRFFRDKAGLASILLKAKVNANILFSGRAQAGHTTHCVISARRFDWLLTLALLKK